ncbi:MAG TPA: LacI family DNA-binding transcriptional regulator [Solirubrobacteraceae bacterium]|nr:LacI family DNA-binding transcriptional regulator [Solirubrobacteraceae bacterium]
MAVQPDRPNRGGRTTIRDIAEIAGVSPATVSRVVNGRTDVSPALRESVMRVVREQGYTTGRAPHPAHFGRTGLVGVTVPLVHKSYFSEILAGASEAFYELDYSIVLSPTLHEHRREVSLVERLMRGLTDGALLVLPEESQQELTALREQGYPFVIVDPHTEIDERVPTVSASNTAGGRSATEHLLSLGHRRIAAITGPRDGIATKERMRGYRGALLDFGILADPALTVESDFSTGGGHRAALPLLSMAERPTAVFAFNDMMAIGVIRAARQLGLRVPEDVSVCGFDDTFEASILETPLTTVRQPLAEMGRMAVSQLARLLQNRRIEALHIQLETMLVVRESTGPVASGLA